MSKYENLLMILYWYYQKCISFIASLWETFCSWKLFFFTKTKLQLTWWAWSDGENWDEKETCEPMVVNKHLESQCQGDGFPWPKKTNLNLTPDTNARWRKLGEMWKGNNKAVDMVHAYLRNRAITSSNFTRLISSITHVFHSHERKLHSKAVWHRHDTLSASNITNFLWIWGWSCRKTAVSNLSPALTAQYSQQVRQEAQHLPPNITQRHVMAHAATRT